MSEWVPRRYTYTLDDQGRLYHAGDQIEHPRMIQAFFRRLEPLPDGRFLSICAGEENYLEVADTPFVVIGVAAERTSGAGIDSVTVRLHDGSSEALDLDTLMIEHDIAYCRVRGTFRARFARQAQQALFAWVRLVGADAQLSVGGRTVTLGTFPDLA